MQIKETIDLLYSWPLPCGRLGAVAGVQQVNRVATRSFKPFGNLIWKNQFNGL